MISHTSVFKYSLHPQSSEQGMRFFHYCVFKTGASLELPGTLHPPAHTRLIQVAFILREVCGPIAAYLVSHTVFP